MTNDPTRGGRSPPPFFSAPRSRAAGQGLVAVAPGSPTAHSVSSLVRAPRSLLVGKPSAAKGAAPGKGYRLCLLVSRRRPLSAVPCRQSQQGRRPSGRLPRQRNFVAASPLIKRRRPRRPSGSAHRPLRLVLGGFGPLAARGVSSRRSRGHPAPRPTAIKQWAYLSNACVAPLHAVPRSTPAIL